MFEVWVKRGKSWHLVGQYASKASAERIAADYRSRGQVAEVYSDDDRRP